MDGLPRPQFRLALLGPFELVGSTGPIDLRNKKLAALLAYLALSAPARLPREKLATLLWGSRPEARARHNLRQALFRLRRALAQDVFLGDAEQVSLQPGIIDCDAVRFEALIREGGWDSLSAAVDLYKGRFLADLTIAEEAWAEWVRHEQLRLETLALDAMVKLGEQRLKAGAFDLALAAADRAIAISNLREDAHRLAIRALTDAGRRSDALKRYEHLVELLKSELDVEPDARTTTLALDLRKSQAMVSVASADLTVSAGAAPELLALPDRPSIAVLPFVNLSGDPAQEYFADGMVDDILMALSRVRWLFVIARQSSFLYKGRAVDMRQIGRELGVRYAMEGSVRKAGNRVRITAQLIETETGSHIWADRYEAGLGEIFALQDEMTERIAYAVELNIQAAEIKRASAKTTGSFTAYDFYLRGLQAYFGYTEADYQRTQALLGKAIEVDPEYAEALGTLTDSVAVSTLMGWQKSRTGGLDEARKLARRALAAGADNSTCVVSSAFTYAVLLHGFDEGLDLADRALALHPNSVLVRNRVASVYAACGDSDKAIAQCEVARRMNPIDTRKSATATSTVLATALYYAGRYEEAITAGRRALAFAVTSSIARKYVAISLAQLGRIDEARAEMAQFAKDQPDASLALFRRQSFRHKWMHELHLEGLRKAGLREE